MSLPRIFSRSIFHQGIRSAALSCALGFALPGCDASPPATAQTELAANPAQSVSTAAATKDSSAKESAEKEAAKPTAPVAPPVPTVSFPFPHTPSGKLLEAELTPPVPVSVSPLPVATEPTVRRPTRLDRVNSSFWLRDRDPTLLPPHVLPVERTAKEKLRTPTDAPPLALGLEVPLPARPHMPVPGLVSVEGPSLSVMPTLATIAKPNPEILDKTYDPTGDALRDFELLPQPVTRGDRIPFLRISIPNPYEHLRGLTAPALPADVDPPSAAPGLPPKPPTPTAKK